MLAAFVYAITAFYNIDFCYTIDTIPFLNLFIIVVGYRCMASTQRFTAAAVYVAQLENL